MYNSKVAFCFWRFPASSRRMGQEWVIMGSVESEGKSANKQAVLACNPDASPKTKAQPAAKL